MVIVLDGHKAERLQHAVVELPRRAQDLGHPVNRSGLRLKRDLHEVACAEGLRQAQEASGYGYGLEISFRAAAIFKANRSQNRISKLDPGSAPRGMRLGEVSHRPDALSHYALLRNR